MRRTFITLSLVVLTLVAINAQQPSQTPTQNMTKVEIKTSLGDIVVALYNETPQHRDNFIKLVNDHYYDGVLFHRVIKDFMVQTGDDKSKTAGPDVMLGDGGVDYTIPAEFRFPQLFHKRGALAAARTGDNVNPERASSGSQFYIVTGKVYDKGSLEMMRQRMEETKKQELFQMSVLANRETIMKLQAASDTTALMKLQNELIAKVEAEYAAAPVVFTPELIEAYSTIGGTPFLDNAYTVFGEVLSGMEVVDAIQNAETGANDRPKTDIRIISTRLLPDK